jgi:hypothetical protein
VHGNTLRIAFTLREPRAVTVKLDAMLEEQLRQRAAATGQITSNVIRQAAVAHLNAPGSVAAPSAHSLSADLFGRHRGAPEITAQRRTLLAEAWAAEHRQRG